MDTYCDEIEKDATYVTYDEAVQREIIDPIEASGEVVGAREEYDIDAIADEVLAGWDEGFRCKVEDDTEYWEIVARHSLPAK